ncbi:MAG: hypothetical protein Q8P46_06920 [Hyphomicrobiales bacterium]|nr:hypothetical protein [Hyphomicrobiales bacterium]
MTDIRDFEKHDRVQTHPATNAWMQGDRYGNVVHVGRKLVYVIMDRSNRFRGFLPDNLVKIDN